jgi:hypothetical protein
MSVIDKIRYIEYALLAVTDTHYQLMMPANSNHTFHVGVWVPKSGFILKQPSQSDNSASCKVEDALETVSEKLDQLRLK